MDNTIYILVYAFQIETRSFLKILLTTTTDQFEAVGGSVEYFREPESIKASKDLINRKCLPFSDNKDWDIVDQEILNVVGVDTTTSTTRDGVSNTPTILPENYTLEFTSKHVNAAGCVRKFTTAPIGDWAKLLAYKIPPSYPEMDNVDITTPEKVIETIITSEKYLEKSKENNTMLSVVDYILDYNNNSTKSYSIPTIDMLVLLAEKTDLLNIMQQKGISKVWSCTPASGVGWIWGMDKYGQAYPQHYTDQLTVIPSTWEWVSE